jgi:hypothetical protein
MHRNAKTGQNKNYCCLYRNVRRLRWQAAQHAADKIGARAGRQHEISGGFNFSLLVRGQGHLISLNDYPGRCGQGAIARLGVTENFDG